MGEIADMMIDGTMCQVCGEFINEVPPGYPITCAGCGGDEFGIADAGPANKPKDPKTIACPDPFCERKFQNRQAAAQHWIDKHGED